MRALSCAAALLGGACWVVRYFTDIEGLYWAGLVLLGITALLAGLAAVPKAPHLAAGDRRRSARSHCSGP